MIWHILTVAPQTEMRVDQALRDMGYETLFPMDYVIRRRNRHENPVVSPVPAMRGYMPIGSEIEPNWAAIHELKSTNGRRMVIGALGHNHLPEPISTLAVQRLRDMCTVGPPEAIPASRQVKVGEVAIILDGPYAGHRVIVRRLKPKDTTVLMNMFGSMREVDITANSLEAAA